MKQISTAALITPATASWITAKRLRIHGLILALCLCSVYTWNMATPGLLDRGGNIKGTDFLHFYTLGSLALSHRGAELYNPEAQSQLAAQRVRVATGIHYLPLYPPQVSIFFAPFASLPYPSALLLWLTLTALLYGACCYATWRTCPNLRNEKLTVVILTLSFPAFWHLIVWGQTSALALACFTLALLSPARTARIPRWPRPRMSNLQTPTRYRRRSHFLCHTPLEANRRRPALSLRATGCRVSLLRPHPAPQLDTSPRLPKEQSLAPRTQALPDPLPARLLDHAPALARIRRRALYPHRAPGTLARHALLAKQPWFASALFRSYASHGSRRPASHGLRSGNPRTSIPTTFRLVHPAPRRLRHPISQTLALFGIRIPTTGPAHPLDPPPANSSRNARSSLCDLEVRRKISAA